MARRSTLKGGRSDQRNPMKRINNRYGNADGRHGLICQHMKAMAEEEQQPTAEA